MPITKELNNVKRLEAAGFVHEQAEAPADIIEQSHVDGQQSLKDFINDKVKEIRSEISSSELRIRASHTDLLMKFFAIVAGCISIALAIAKLLW